MKTGPIHLILGHSWDMVIFSKPQGARCGLSQRNQLTRMHFDLRTFLSELTVGYEREEVSVPQEILQGEGRS